MESVEIIFLCPYYHKQADKKLMSITYKTLKKEVIGDIIK